MSTSDGVQVTEVASAHLLGIAGKLRALGRQISPSVLQEVRSLYAPLLLQQSSNADSVVSRDVPYGPHARHRLNIFSPRTAASAGDVMLFVHGGGFMTGDKEEVPNVFFDNVGRWAAINGIVGLTINYRLAPDHPWPAGSEDVAAAVAWARGAVDHYGGNPERIFLMGHSAGAAHVAGFLADPRLWANESPGVAGCVCVSGVYDLNVRPVSTAYFGTDESLYASRSPLAGLARSAVPLLVTVAENDPEMIQRHALSLLSRCLEEKKSLPKLSQICDHNHFSTLLHLNSPDHSLADPLLRFIHETGSLPYTA